MAVPYDLYGHARPSGVIGLDPSAPRSDNNGFSSPRPTPEQQRALDLIYDGAQAETRPEAPAAGQMYGYALLPNLIDRRGRELWADTGASAASTQHRRRDFLDAARTTRLDDVLMTQIAEKHFDNLLAAARPLDDADALDEEITDRNAETRDALQARYGADAEALLERTQRFVRSHPKLATILQHRGLGSDPHIVQALVSHVFSNGIR